MPFAEKVCRYLRTLAPVAAKDAAVHRVVLVPVVMPDREVTPNRGDRHQTPLPVLEVLVQLQDLYPSLQAPQGRGQGVPLTEHLYHHRVDGFIHFQVLLFPGHLVELLLGQILWLQLQISRLLMVTAGSGELSQLGEVLHPGLEGLSGGQGGSPGGGAGSVGAHDGDMRPL